MKTQQHINNNRPDLLWISGLLIITALFFIFKTFGFNYYAGDEYIYLAQAKLVAGGLIPYRDFAAAHPPLQMLLLAPFFKIHGY